LLLVIYPIIVIPIVIVLMIRDLLVKQEGVLTWHRDSFGILLQRFVISVLMMAVLVIYRNCANNSLIPDGTCISRSLIPLTIPFTCVLCKVVCLKS
jgi:hypothetical protein